MKGNTVVLIAVILIVCIGLLIGVMLCCKNKNSVKGGKSHLEPVNDKLIDLFDTTGCQVGYNGPTMIMIDIGFELPFPLGSPELSVPDEDLSSITFDFAKTPLSYLKTKDFAIAKKFSTNQSTGNTYYIMNDKFRKQLIESNGETSLLSLIEEVLKEDTNELTEFCAELNTQLNDKDLSHLSGSMVGQPSCICKPEDVIGWTPIVYGKGYETKKYRGWYRPKNKDSKTRGDRDIFYMVGYRQDDDGGIVFTSSDNPGATASTWQIADIIPASYRSWASRVMYLKGIDVDYIAVWNFICELINTKAACLMHAGLNKGISNTFYIKSDEPGLSKLASIIPDEDVRRKVLRAIEIFGEPDYESFDIPFYKMVGTLFDDDAIVGVFDRQTGEKIRDLIHTIIGKDDVSSGDKVNILNGLNMLMIICAGSKNANEDIQSLLSGDWEELAMNMNIVDDIVPDFLEKILEVNYDNRSNTLLEISHAVDICKNNDRALNGVGVLITFDPEFFIQMHQRYDDDYIFVICYITNSRTLLDIIQNFGDMSLNLVIENIMKLRDDEIAFKGFDNITFFCKLDDIYELFDSPNINPIELCRFYATDFGVDVMFNGSNYDFIIHSDHPVKAMYELKDMIERNKAEQISD